MFSAGPFKVGDEAELAAFLARHPFATLVANGPGGLIAARTPMMADLDEDGRIVSLTGHVAKANPFWQAVGEGAEALALFSGAGAYVSPGWYASKAETGKAVPTWNYSAAELSGTVTAQHDRGALLWIVDRLSTLMEAGRPQLWRTDQAPADYIERLLGGIVGLKLAVKTAGLTRKLSQNKSEADFAGVVAALSTSTDYQARQVAADMTELTRG